MKLSVFVSNLLDCCKEKPLQSSINLHINFSPKRTWTVANYPNQKTVLGIMSNELTTSVSSGNMLEIESCHWSHPMGKLQLHKDSLNHLCADVRKDAMQDANFLFVLFQLRLK